MVIAIVACHRGPEVQPYPVRELGDYSYRIAGTPVSGKFSILADTVTLDAQQQSCRRVGTGVLNPEIHPFRCVGGSAVFNVMISSRYPSQSTWSTAQTVKKTVEVCTKYGYTTTGQKVCSSSRTEVRTETVGDRGLLDVTRIASADKP